ncbi:MAG: Flp family type IVb pilin [Azospirillaceae bacterium]
MVEVLRVYLRSVIRSERGASAIEYGLIAALIAAVIIAAVFALGELLQTTFEDVADGIEGAADDAGTGGT